ncbi:unnamed protein product, partial [marine sediment metagenome]
IIERKLRDFSDSERLKVRKEKDNPIIKCKVCGALAYKSLWDKYGGNCPICVERKKREKRDARVKTEAEKKTKVEKKTEEVSEGEGLPLRVTFGFGAFVALLLGLIKKFRG